MRRVDEIRELMVDLQVHKFSTVSDFTHEIIKTIFGNESDDDDVVEELFHFANVQMLELGMDLDNDHRLHGHKPEKKVT